MAAKDEKMKTQDNKELELELMKAKLALLESKVVKPQTSEEEFQKRVEAYEAKQAERDELKAKIDSRRMELLMSPELMGKARMDDVILIEAWERRAKTVESKNPQFANRLRSEIKRKIKDIQQDPMRG